MQLHELSIQKTHDLLTSQKISSEELTRAYLERIHRLDPQVKSYVMVTDNLAMEQAQDADQRFKKNQERSPLTGIPYSAKDSISTRGINTTCSSRVLENYKPFYDATAIRKLNSTDSILLGKNNMDEFGMGSPPGNQDSSTPRTRWTFEHVLGGARGGA